MELEIPEDVKNLRLDPGEAAGGLVLRKLAFENDIKADFTTNGFPVGADSYYSVSYTHLDVYKRQIMRFRDFTSTTMM